MLKQNVEDLISNATRNNWKKLDSYGEGKLVYRANKKLSNKNILPLGYFSHIDNLPRIEQILLTIKDLDAGIFDVLYSLSINLLKRYSILEKSNVKTVMNEYKDHKVISELEDIDLPKTEKDVLGLIYQSLLPEGERNTKGIYYTPEFIVLNMTESLDFSKGQLFLDPSCGSGAFLLGLKVEDPSQIYGSDIDPIAVMIAKVNMLIKYKNHEFIPHIYCLNFLENNEYCQEKFDYIITNPPWGVTFNVFQKGNKIKSHESFSLFFEKANLYLKQGGVMRFLFPKAILNVAMHKEIRLFMLKHGNINQITYYPNVFNGVSTKAVEIFYEKAKSKRNVKFCLNGQTVSVSKIAFEQTNNFVFNILNETDLEIVAKVKKQGKYSLSNSTWALGIVTGNNKKSLTTQYKDDHEAIYTGKEIQKYRIKDPYYFILYNRERLQQAADEKIYRTKEKLVYKFISKKLSFAYDDKGRLFLNSANILIPNIPKMSIKTVMAFLNSELYQYLYMSLFNQNKILKSDLCELPFLDINEEENLLMEGYVQKILDGEEKYIEKVDMEVYKLFNVTHEEISYIKEKINGDLNR